MRQIKFRAWDKIGEQWIYFHVPWDFFTGSKVPESFDRWGQYTGLTDKNRKEIYEGDIVRHRKLDRPEDGIMYGLPEQFMGKRPREVRFEGYGFVPLAGWIDDALKDMEWEVIGNIYENPDLITAEIRPEAQQQ